MKVLCYDCFSGISGDMNLGAMLALGIEESYLIGELKKLNLDGWELLVEKDQRHGIAGIKATVRQKGHDHSHRHLSDIEKIISDSGLGEDVKKLSMRIFMKVAEAEAHVHGIPVDRVHFHEVGAIDSIIDIAGAAICFSALKVDAVYVSEVELGGGFVVCEHGTLPVPAPATAEIIKGIPVRKGGLDFEATTPTGAAILAALGTDFSKTHSLKILKTAYGIGQKEHNDVPNLLRVSLGETTDSENTGHNAVHLECNIDDMNPEFYDYISEKLFSAGASDVFFTNIIMKKGRPGIILNVICETGHEDNLKELIFKESTTVGIRTVQVRKDTLVREFTRLNTKFGEVTVKHSYLKGSEVSVKPEFDDVRRIAAENGIPVKDVYSMILSMISANRK
ncbi:MAG TPA: nickel pincer cofactor biosynthesis protein LarC [Bacteroidales bacterium]|nr:nickel pincer cofactor biosynthesis protein LarC [Bacteroidales bacterium]HNR42357.1 nickel pincer cofactor biosynthesis protein LarC [Bacteroidales bacterium]HPM17976.1 nickel pincer cofactor biosynthesis protein LarC [Bacteroidales bacterium]HQG76234.1 nickel pincer cofactor biosynthesis protein LarC [Bacteroidales bacterium]